MGVGGYRTLGATSVGGEEVLLLPTVVRAGREGVPSRVGGVAGVTAAAVLLSAASCAWRGKEALS